MPRNDGLQVLQQAFNTTNEYVGNAVKTAIPLFPVSNILNLQRQGIESAIDQTTKNFFPDLLKPKPSSKPSPIPGPPNPNTLAKRSENLGLAQKGNVRQSNDTDDIATQARKLSAIDRENRDYNSARDIDFTKRNLTEISPMVSGILSDRERTSLANQFPYQMYNTQSQMQDNAYQTTSNNNTRKISDLLASAKGRYY